MRRNLLILAVPFALLVLLPSAAAQEQADPGGFHGFASFETRAQGQVAELTGYLNAFREDNRIMGAMSEINGPPANSRNYAAMVQRGEAATFIYGVIGGGGGERGTLPDPPPGEANAFYPTDPPEMTVGGPVASGTNQVLDGKFHAKATEVPTGRSEATGFKLFASGFFTAQSATVVSHTEPVEGGIQAESVTVLRQVEAGPLLIQTLVSRAMAFVPSQGGEPTGIASTVVEGATVGGQPVQITDQGVVASEEPSSLNQEAVNKAFADGGFEQVRLLPSSAVSSDEGQAVFADAGVLEFVKQDQAFGASNPQGFSGGGFAFGGATAGISTVRCFPDCPEGLGLPDDPVSGDGDIPSLPADSSDPESSGTDPSSASGDPSFASGVTTTPVDAGLSTDAGSGLSYAADNYLSGGGLSLPTGPSLDYSSTTAYTPPDLNTATGGAQQAAAPLVNQQVALASSGLGPEEADWVRDLYLGVGVAAGVLFVGSRLAQAFR